jgi:hypothetical protein
MFRAMLYSPGWYILVGLVILLSLAGAPKEVILTLIGFGILIFFWVLFNDAKSTRRSQELGGNYTSRPKFDSDGRVYCNACGGYVERHDPANHPEYN